MTMLKSRLTRISQKWSRMNEGHRALSQAGTCLVRTPCAESPPVIPLVRR